MEGIVIYYDLMEGKQRKTDSSLFFLLISGESMN
jgi:hypothetical protein